jgi:hypothetical protein
MCVKTLSRPGNVAPSDVSHVSWIMIRRRGGKNSDSQGLLFMASNARNVLKGKGTGDMRTWTMKKCHLVGGDASVEDNHHSVQDAHLQED